MKPLEKRKAKNHKLPLSRHFLKFKTSLFVKFSHKLSPLFNRFSTFDKNVNLSKSKPGSKKFLSCLPLAKYLDFYDASKNSELIKTFREARLKSHPPKFKSLTFLNKKKRKSNPKMEKFSNSFHNGVKTFTQQSREKDNLIKKLIQIF